MDLQSNSAKSPEHSPRNYVSLDQAPLFRAACSPAGPQTQPRGEGESSPVALSVGQLRPPCTLGTTAFPSTLLWLQDQPHQTRTALTSGQVRPSGKRQNTDHVTFPKCPLSSLIPKPKWTKPPVKNHSPHSKHHTKYVATKEITSKDKGLGTAQGPQVRPGSLRLQLSTRLRSQTPPGPEVTPTKGAGG